MSFLNKISRMINKVNHRTDKLLAYEEKINRQNMARLGEILVQKERDKEHIFHALGIGDEHRFDSDKLFFVVKRDSHTGKDLDGFDVIYPKLKPADFCSQ